MKWISENEFATTSWDGSFKVFQLNQNGFHQVYHHQEEVPILCFTSKNGNVLLGLMDGTVIMLEDGTRRKIIHKTDSAVQQVFFLFSKNQNKTFIFLFLSSKVVVLENSQQYPFEYKFDYNVIKVQLDLHDKYFNVIFTENKYASIPILTILQNRRTDYFNNSLNSKLSCIQRKNGYSIISSYGGRV